MDDGKRKIETKADLVLSLLLRVGVLACALVIAAGWIGNLARPAPPADAALPQLLRGEILPAATVSHSLAEVAGGLAQGRSGAVMLLGLMLLIALPIVRVALTAAAFSLERDWFYVALSLLVLALLLSGLLLGRAL
jgi:uncharacterized membrane protein